MEDYLKFKDNSGKEYMLVKSNNVHFPFGKDIALCYGCAFQNDDANCRVATCKPKDNMGKYLTGNEMIWKEIK